MRRGVLFFLLAVFVSAAHAQDFSGTWFMKGNGFPFVLEINQFPDGTVTGTMMALEDIDSTIQGRVAGRKITFTRTNPALAVPQEYVGYLYERAPNNNEMAGTFTHLGQSSYGWHAEKP
jgi:hypothetical protein